MEKSIETFKPGLFDIGLNIEKKLNNHYLFIENKQLTFYHKIEPSYIKPALRNLQAVFFFHMDAGRTTARSVLEELTKKDPKDLNALADLIYIYKKMGRESDADRYKQQLELHKNDQLSQAKSILGQANALTFDLADNHNKSTEVLLKDSWRQLNANSKNSEQLSKANELIVKASTVMNTIPETAHEKKIDVKEMAVEKFEKGIKMLENLNRSEEEIMAWKHNLAIARSKLDTWRNRRGDDTNNRFENYQKALETHLDVIDHLSKIKDLEEPLRLYLAKSYMYFGQVYTSGNYHMEQDKLPDRIKSQDVNNMLEKAKSTCPKDHIILRRYGRYWSNKRNNLKAIENYSESINLIPDPDINWFAYSSRRDAYYYHSQSLTDPNEITKNLKHAHDDGKVCMRSKCTDTCMFRMAQICFKLSIPNWNKFECQKKDFIYEALEIIHEALNKRDISKDGKFYGLLGNYYPYIGEYRKAIESLKTTLELNKWSGKFSTDHLKHSSNAFKTLTECFMAFYEEANDTNLLTEFRFMLKEAKKRNLDDWVTNAMKMVHDKNTEMMRSLVRNMIEWDAKSCEMFIRKALKYQECWPLMGEFQRKLQEEDNQETEINGPNEIQNSQRSVNFKHDFFVLHSEKDKDWVNNMLRPQLEEYDDDIKFKGFIPSRDFILGENRIDSIIQGIKNSRKLLIVLSPKYLEDNWQKYISDTMLISFIETKVKGKTIIPIILETCCIPYKLKTFTPICFANGSDWERLRMSLTINMDSETGLEAGMSTLEIKTGSSSL